MWKMFDDVIECNECGGLRGEPPKFMIPPPPRPPSMGSLSNCNEEEMALKSKQAWDMDICEAMPILDASLYSSHSLQTSAMIAVFSLLLVLVILISSLFVWKNKRKVQNFLPCKTPTRGPHLNGALPIVNAHSVTYEDPDVHLGHRRPLVIRHHHNIEVLHGGKSIHYPSGYPMTRSPPFLVSSSPGPDPYRSNDNVYEELGPGRDSDGDSEGPIHSDDEFAEDELSLPGERSFSKATNIPEAPATLPSTSSSYHERERSVNVATSSANGPERNSVLSSSSSTQDASTTTAASSLSSHNNNSNNNNNNNTRLSSGAGATPARSGLFGGMLRHTTGRSKFHTANGARSRTEQENCLGSSHAADLTPIQQLYDNRSNLMSLGHVPQQLQSQSPRNYRSLQPPHAVLQSNQLNNNNTVRSTAPQFYNTLENEVERRNRINAQLNHVPAVATIFRERIHYPAGGRYPQAYYTSQASSGAARSRTNPRSLDGRRQRLAPPVDAIEPAYSYAEPLYHENYHYDSCGVPTGARLGYPPAYGIAPDYISGGHSHNATYRPTVASNTYQNPSPLYAQGGDSSFGSDSGYSHHTPASSIGRHDYEVTVPAQSTTANTGQRTPSKLSAAFNFTSWSRRKANTDASSGSSAAPYALNVQQQNSSTPSSGSGAEATSPNNNSASSTVTSTLENSSSASSSNTNNNNNNNNSTCGQQLQTVS